ncbi:hypothetical protein [Acetobacter sp. P5B1]|uniref:hypothetical protein n=1 Tax=Acetobacter sp. P5B1 TaxID=2762620 RepID=UPI001C040CB3|nr:hypothetical protein [Acetobacter sp. P5B1]
MPSKEVQSFLHIIFSIGARDYKFSSESRAKAKTKKMWRLSLPNRIPFAVQINTKIPIIWMAAKDERNILKALGKWDFYPSSLDDGERKGSHSNLTQIEEFRNRPDMVKVTITTHNPTSIQQAFSRIIAH